DLAVAHRDDLALLGLLLRSVGDDDSALDRFLLLDSLHQQAVVKRTNLRHRCVSSFFRAQRKAVTPETPPDPFDSPWGAGPPYGRPAIGTRKRRLLTNIEGAWHSVKATAKS